MILVRAGPESSELAIDACRVTARDSQHDDGNEPQHAMPSPMCPYFKRYAEVENQASSANAHPLRLKKGPTRRMAIAVVAGASLSTRPLLPKGRVPLSFAHCLASSVESVFRLRISKSLSRTMA